MMKMTLPDISRIISSNESNPSAIADLAAFANLVPVSFTIKAPDGRIIIANSAARALLTGDRMANVIGKKVDDFVSDEKAHQLREACLAVIERREVIETEEQHWDAAMKEMRWSLVTRAPVTALDGTIIGVAVCARDITERKNMEDRLNRAISAAHIDTWEWDIRTDTRTGSSKREAFYGLSVGALSNDSTTLATVHPDDRVAYVNARTSVKYAKTEFTLDHEFRIINADGEVRWLKIICRPQISNGEVRRVNGVVMDITEQKRSDAALRAALARAEMQDAAKSRFLAAAGHDLRQPVQSLMLYGESLKPHITENGQEIFSRLRKGFETLHSLLTSMLDVTRLDCSLVSPKIENVPLHDIIEQIVAFQRPAAQAKNIDLFAVPTTAIVRTDRNWLMRMIGNLTENAIKYTSVGRVLIDCVTLEDHVEVSVRDSGIGIPDSEIENIWGEFHQLGNPERDRARGMGLGLSIVRRLADLLGCPVKVQSRLGEGSIFTVTIPRVVKNDPRKFEAETNILRFPKQIIINAAENSGNAEIISVKTSPIILVVDDDADVREAFVSFIENEDNIVLAASSVIQAKSLSQRSPDVILMDYHLGVDTGTNAISILRKHWEKDIPAILLTGDTDDELFHEAENLGMRVMTKPIDPIVLRAAIQSILNRNAPSLEALG